MIHDGLVQHFQRSFQVGNIVKPHDSLDAGGGFYLCLHRLRLRKCEPRHHDACIRHGCGKLLLHYLQRHCRFRVCREVCGHIIIHFHAEKQNRAYDRGRCEKHHDQLGMSGYPSGHSIHCCLRKMNILCHLYFKHLSADVQQQFCEQLYFAIFFVLGWTESSHFLLPYLPLLVRGSDRSSFMLQFLTGHGIMQYN